MSRPEPRPFAQELVLTIASTVAAELLIAARGVLRREHEAWMARRDKPQPKGRRR